MDAIRKQAKKDFSVLKSGLNGERLSLDIVLVGRGSVEGIVRTPDGTLLPDTTIFVSSAKDMSRYVTQTDQNGFYNISGIPVGAMGLFAQGPVGSARATGVIEESKSTATVDITIFTSFSEGMVNGEVQFPNGEIAANMEVFLLLENPTFGKSRFLDASMTDEAGTFRFEGLPPGSYLARALNAARGFNWGCKNFDHRAKQCREPRLRIRCPFWHWKRIRPNIRARRVEFNAGSGSARWRRNRIGHSRR